MNKNIQFRDVTTSGKNKCQCGRVIGTYVMWITQYRVKAGSRWSKWRDVNSAPKEKVNRELDKYKLGTWTPTLKAKR